MNALVRGLQSALCAGALLAAGSAGAVQFELDIGSNGLQGVLNTTITAGAGLRMEGRSQDLLAKGNQNPNVCSGEQTCQGVFKDQTHPGRTGARAPGQATYNADDGNWNYDRHDLTQAVFKVRQDLNLTYGNFGFFSKWLYFYDFVNNDFTEYHPNRVTPENREQTGITGDPAANALFSRVYGPGAVVRNDRTNGEVLREIGTNLQMFDYYFYGTQALPEWAGSRELTFKIGNQTVNWGESTALVINSVNSANPVNANNLTRVGFDLSELYVPTGMLFLSMEPFEATTVEFFYKYDWKPTEIPAPGSFFSFADIGTNNTNSFVGFNFGTPAEDPNLIASPPDNPLAGLTNTATAIRRLSDRTPREAGQFGLAFKYFADWLNNGTEIGLYFMNYHSTFPYVSFVSADKSCARQGGNHGSQNGVEGQDIDATDIVTLGLACPDLPITHASTGLPIPPQLGLNVGDDNPQAATSDAVPLDTVRFMLEYPQDIQMYGLSFNTTVGDISLQGEVAYRPQMPLQVDREDLAFLAVAPTLGSCSRPDAGCTGSSGGVGTDGVPYGSSDFTPYPGHTAYTDTFDLGLGSGVGSGRSFPSFIGAYRGFQAGEYPANRYIRGWEKFDVYQFNLGGTYIQGATDNPIGASQVIWLVELGAQWVPNLPGTDRLQIEAPGTYYHASAGADGTMTGNYRQDCANTPDCNYSGWDPYSNRVWGDCNTPHPATSATGCGDGLRFNPHQQPAEGYADPFSTGIVLINLTRYESVFPGISFAPITIFMYDIYGTSTDVASQFTEGRKDLQFIFETRYKESLSLNLGYYWFWGGGKAN
ncbi:MAG TPA: DUF1302 family protein, partial [Candidatus Binatia bacterium]|nr:DUF1302 family protein [Candidatus Binatia bacterium]